MAMGPSRPPRAYTREILTTAFNWLQTQPDSTRVQATTPDALVAMYMLAQRGGATPTAFEAEAPVSSQAFMSDLKNLAENLKEFEPVSARATAPPASLKAQLNTYPQMEARPAAVYPSNLAASVAPVAAAAIGVAAAASTLSDRLNDRLNDRSLEMLREVQLALNLTSETEAMNMMIALAHKSLKSLLA